MRHESPDWVRDGLVQFRGEIALFARTLVLSSLRPRRFTRGWLRGEIRALNPFGYLLTAIGLVGAVRTLTIALGTEKADEGSFAHQVLAAVVPPLYFLTLGLAAHAFLWLMGMRQARLRETAAVALYASGPAYVGHAILVCFVAAFLREHANVVATVIVAIVGLASIVAFVVPFVASLRELHATTRAPWLRPIAAFAVVFILSGFFFGAVRPPGHFGLHPTIRLPSAAHPHGVFFFGTTVF